MRKFIFIIFIAFYSCSGVSKAKKIKAYIPADLTSFHLSKNTEDSLKLTYIGCGGFLIQQDTTALLLDPYFSNVGPLPFLAFKRLKPDTTIIDNFFKKHFRDQKDTKGIIKSIIVAHSHYDHLADVPSIYLRNCNKDSTQIIGGPTTKHILKGSKVKKETVLIKPTKETNSETNHPKNYSWIYTKNKAIKILPIQTEHAPHFCGVKFISSKKLNKDLDKYPSKVRKFPEGENYNFLIDILDDNGNIKLRIFSHAGAACDGLKGIPNDSILAKKGIDILFLCAANFNQVKNYPEQVIEKLKPKFIIGNHWENFFRSYKKNISKPGTVPNTNVENFIQNVNQQLKRSLLDDSTEFILPLPNTTIKVHY